MSKILLLTAIIFISSSVYAQNIGNYVHNATAAHYIEEVENCNQILVHDYNEIYDNQDASGNIRKTIKCYSGIAHEIFDKYLPSIVGNPKEEFESMNNNSQQYQNVDDLQNSRANIEQALRSYISQVPQE